jgi:hypothetical protein
MHNTNNNRVDPKDARERKNLCPHKGTLMENKEHDIDHQEDPSYKCLAQKQNPRVSVATKAWREAGFIDSLGVYAGRYCKECDKGMPLRLQVIGPMALASKNDSSIDVTGGLHSWGY